MPFYIAIPRKTTASGGVQRGTYVKAEYIRTDPSRLRYQTATAYSSPASAMVRSMIPSIMQAIDRKEYTARPHTDTYFYPPLTVNDLPYMTLPDVQIQFQGNPMEGDLETIQNLGGTARRIKGARVDTWCITPASWNDIGAIYGISSTMSSNSATEGAILIPHIETLVLLITRVAVVSTALQITSILSDFEITMHFKGDVVDLPSAPQEVLVNPEDAPMDGTQRRGSQTTTVAVPFNTDITDMIDFQITLTHSGVPRPFVTVDNAHTILGGIFIAFEPAYSGYDNDILTMFVNKFKGVIFDGLEQMETSEMYSHWSPTISRTTTGQYLAHMMKVCLIAEELGSWPQFIIRPDGKYEGAIIMGLDIRIRHVGMSWTEGMSQEALLDDMKACLSHNSSVKKILELVGLTASSPEDFTTVRQLSQAVNASGFPSGMAMNSIKKLLGSLSFIEKPVGLNAHTMKQTIQLLTSDAPVPADLYMDRGAFFPQNRETEVLSMFGNYVPSLNWGGVNPVRCCDIRGKGVPAELEFSRTPPQRLTLKVIPIGSAWLQWKDLLEHGVIRRTIANIKASDREFQGEEKKLIWETLDDCLRSTIIPAGGRTAIAPAVVPVGDKRMAPDNTVVMERDAKRKRLFG